jgi:hypothetical protein
MPSGVPSWTEQPRPHRLDIVSVNAKGDASPVSWKTQTAAAWVDGVPALRVWIDAPADVTRVSPPKTVASPPAAAAPAPGAAAAAASPTNKPASGALAPLALGYSLNANPKDSPFAKATGKVISLDLYSGGNLTPFSVRRVGPKDQVSELNILVSPDVDRTAFFSHAFCQEIGVRFTTVKDKGRFLFAAGSCAALPGGRVEVRVFRSQDAQWTSLPKRGVQRQKDDSVLFVLEKPKPGSAIPPVVVPLALKGRTAKESTEIRVAFSEPPALKRGGVILGLGLTGMNYLENGTENPAHVAQFGLTGKVTAFYLIKPGMFDAGANAFVTLYPFYHAPDDRPSARTFGANMRLGYQLPVLPGGVAINFSAGWYFWGMLVSAEDEADKYGIQLLSGPQMFVLARGTLKDGRMYSAYFKYAPISADFSLNVFGSREVAIGGAFPISGIRAKYPLAITLDVADALLDVSDGDGNQVRARLSTVSLGVQITF